MRDGFYALGARGKATHERIFGARGSVAAAPTSGSQGNSPAATLPSESIVDEQGTLRGIDRSAAPRWHEYINDPNHPAHDPA